jgi:hypothetical protein
MGGYNMKKVKKICLMLAVLIIIGLIGCGNTTSNVSAEESKQWMTMVRREWNFEEWCDTEEGVHYIFYQDYRVGVAAISVRYNSDGTPYNCKDGGENE